MSSDVVTSLISGGVSIVCAFGSIILKDHLDHRRAREPADTRPQAPAPMRSPPSGATVLTAVLLSGLAIASGFFGSHLLRYEVAGLYLFMWLDLGLCLLLLMVFIRRKTRSLFAYQLAALALWSGLLAGLSAQTQGLHSDGIRVVLFAWVATAVAGLIAFAVVPRPH